MSIFYTAVFAVLVIEMLIFVVLIAPFPQSIRKPVLLWFSRSKTVEYIKAKLSILFVFVGLLFIDSVVRVLYRSEPASQDIHSESLSRARMFYAQRNLYLTGSVVFLTLILNRFQAMLVEVFKSDEKMSVLKKQADQTTKEYIKLLDSGSSVSEEISILKEKLLASEKQIKASESLVKQAKQQGDEYMRLADKFNDLEKLHLGRTGEKKKDI